MINKTFYTIKYLTILPKLVSFHSSFSYYTSKCLRFSRWPNWRLNENSLQYSYTIHIWVFTICEWNECGEQVFLVLYTHWPMHEYLSIHSHACVCYIVAHSIDAPSWDLDNGHSIESDDMTTISNWSARVCVCGMPWIVSQPTDRLII